MTKITVVTPVLNDRNGIVRTLASVASQTGVTLEHIVVDGGSTDGTVEALESCVDCRFQLVRGPDEGLYDAINKGIAKATGESIAVLNSGDVYADDHCLEALAQILDGAVDDVVACGRMLVSMSNGEVRTLVPNTTSRFLFLRGCDVPHPTTLIPRKVYERHGLYEKRWKIQGDYELLYRFHRNGVRFEAVDRVIVKFAPAGISRSFWRCLSEAYKVRTHLDVHWIGNIWACGRAIIWYCMSSAIVLAVGPRGVKAVRSILRGRERI